MQELRTSLDATTTKPHGPMARPAIEAEPARGARKPPRWQTELRRFERPSNATAAWQLGTSLLPLGGMYALTYLALASGRPTLSLLLAIPTAAFMVRLFMIFHDCVHGSFVRSRRLRTWIGRSLGIISFVPFGEWQYSHLRHHATAGDLDRRGSGDIATLTVTEYLARSRSARALYRLYRNPLIMYGLGPLYFFVLAYHLPRRGMSAARLKGMLYNNLAVATYVAIPILVIGWSAYLSIQLPTLFIAGVVGIWLFYVQHNFNPSYWQRHGAWTSEDAALRGSSYYKLPKVLQWVTASIGLHHVHHLHPRIPNYCLQDCLDATPELQGVPAITLWESRRLLSLDLWDEERRSFVSFASALRR